MTRAKAKRPAQDGYILVAVLGVMLLLTGFMAAGSMLVRSALSTAKGGDADTAMAGLTQGGLELTAYQLFVLKAAPAAVDGRRLRFGGGTISTRIVDESGKADLNGSDPRLLDAIFRAAGLEERVIGPLMAYVVDTRGADRNSSEHREASPATALAAATPDKAATRKMLRGFQSVDQLMDFPTMSRSEMRALTPLLTVFNPDGKINVRSASPKVLKAIPGLSEATAELILKRRNAASRKEIDALLATSKGTEPYQKTEFGPAFTVRVDAATGEGRKKAINAVIAASKSPSVPYYVFAWWE